MGFNTDQRRADKRFPLRPTRRQLLAATGAAGIGGGRGHVSARWTADPSDVSLRKLASDIRFRIGSLHYLDAWIPDPTVLERHKSVMAREFNLAVIDSGPLHWGGYGSLRPAPDQFEFGPVDEAVSFAEEHRMVVEGHHLAWGRQDALPQWLLTGGYSGEALLEILDDHVRTVVGRYEGRIRQWSVVNEPFEDDGSYKTGPDRWGWWNDHSPWTNGIDPDYIDVALRAAHEADPDARLFINEYAAEELNPKSDALYALVGRLKERDVPIHGIGMQMHLPSGPALPDKASVVANMRRFYDDLGVRIYVTECDVNISSQIAAVVGTTQEERYESQAHVYQAMLEACLESEACRSFAVFGFWDPASWLTLSGFPDASACLFDESWKAKPAYTALKDVLAAAERA